MSPVITLLTDFGSADSYVAEVKGVLLVRAPAAVLVDVTHEIPPGDVRTAQYVLSRVWRRFPPGTVHLAVVDPGVGTERRALAAECQGCFFVAPDNGLLSFLAREARWVALTVPGTASATFHGRDVFASAAAALASGAELRSLGRDVDDPRQEPLPTPHKTGGEWRGEVLVVDRFGTLITNLSGGEIDPGKSVRVGETDVGSLRRTFGDVPQGSLVVFVGSGGTVEVAVRNGSAAERLAAGAGTPVRAGARGGGGGGG